MLMNPTMSNFPFYEPKLKDAGAFHDLRGRHGGGYGWRGSRPSNEIRKITVHHTVTNPRNNMLREVDEVAQIHKNHNGWGGIGYHFIISTEVVNGYAKVAYVGDVLSVRAHAINSKGLFGLTQNAGNYWFLGISIIGRFDQGAMPSSAQLKSLKLLISELLYQEDHRLPSLRSWDDVIGHKTTDYTACPGDWDRMKPLIMNTDVNNGSTPKPDPKPTPNTGKVTVKSGWGLSHVAVSVGLPANEDTYKAIYSLNQGHRGSWDWQSLNARMGAGDVLNVPNPSKPEPKPEPKPMYKVILGGKVVQSTENEQKAVEVYNQQLVPLLDGRLEIQKDGKKYKDYLVEMNTIYEVSVNITPVKSDIDTLEEAIKIFQKETKKAKESGDPVKIELYSTKIKNGDVENAVKKLEEVVEQDKRYYEYQVIVNAQTRDKFTDKTKAETQFHNYVKDAKNLNAKTPKVIELAELGVRERFNGKEYTSKQPLLKEVVEYVEPLPEPNAFKSLLILISDFIKSIFNNK